ncbi:zinc ribbon domain-containing protein [Streptomyces mirabilis]
MVANRWYPSSKTCSHCGAVDTCPHVMDRDENAARNLAALAVAATKGTGVAGDLDTPRVSKPRGAVRKTRTTRRSRKAAAGRAGGATLPHQRQTETRDRTQAEALTLS